MFQNKVRIHTPVTGIIQSKYRTFLSTYSSDISFNIEKIRKDETLYGKSSNLFSISRYIASFIYCSIIYMDYITTYRTVDSLAIFLEYAESREEFIDLLEKFDCMGINLYDILTQIY